MIRAKVYRCSSVSDKFETADRTYVGSILIAWKECVEREGEKEQGESPWLNFEEELRDPESDCTVDISGSIFGQLKWVKFGSKDSGYNSDGTKREAPKAQKTVDDFKGKKVGDAGTLSLNPKAYVHPVDLPLNTKYQILYRL